jgi:hypothetical protein
VAAPGLRTSNENEIVFVMKHPCEWRFNRAIVRKLCVFKAGRKQILIVHVHYAFNLILNNYNTR